MRAFRLAGVAAQAETLRLRRRLRVTLRRAARAGMALPFALATVVFLELALWLALSARLPGWEAALGAAGVNLILAALLALPALRSPAPDPLAEDAARLRREALAGIAAEWRWPALLVEVAAAALAITRKK